MFISSENLLQLIESPTPIISPCDRTFIEGNMYDMRLEQIYVSDDPHIKSFIGQRKRFTPTIKPLFTTNPEHFSSRLEVTNDTWKLYPGFYLAQTVETITPPRWLLALLDERTSIFRGGAITRATKVPHGFSGNITAAIHVPEDCHITLEKGARFLSVCFALCVTLRLNDQFEPVLPLELSFDGGHSYQGIWGGEKVTTEGTERAY